MYVFQGSRSPSTLLETKEVSQVSTPSYTDGTAKAPCALKKIDSWEWYNNFDRRPGHYTNPYLFLPTAHICDGREDMLRVSSGPSVWAPCL
jgi:hypothetical protein